MATATTPDATRQAETWLARLGEALAAGEAESAAELFAPEGAWRDLVAFTWNILTVEGRDAIAAMLESTLDAVRPHDLALREPATGGEGRIVEAWFGFATAAGRGIGHVRLRDGRAVTLLTALRELSGHEERRGLRRPFGTTHGVEPGRRSWRARREARAAELGRATQPEVLVVGGGQAGLALAARLGALGVDTLVVDRRARPGDQWRSRYATLCLHDPVWMDHMPYLPFPDIWPVFTPKDKMADWLAMYAEAMEIDFWGGTTVTGASYEEDGGEWEVQVARDGDRLTLRPRQLVLATGLSGRPKVPRIPGRDEFAGVQQHSSEHPGPEGWAGRRAVVIGSNNSAFDISAALFEGGAEVTMVQRSPTTVVRSDTFLDVALRDVFSEEALAAGIDTERADLLLASVPHRQGIELARGMWERIRERDADFYAALEGAGFLHDFGPDGTGASMKYLRRASGYYIDVGGAELIIDGRIALAVGQVTRLTRDAVVLEDGTELPADLVVYATGYGPMSDTVADIVSPEVAARIGPVWGLGSGVDRDPGPWEGELRNAWKPTAQPGLWIQTGNLQMARHYSLYLALQLAARAAGMATPVYRGI